MVKSENQSRLYKYAPLTPSSRGIYRIIRSGGIIVYFHAEDFVEDPEVEPIALYSARNPTIPLNDIDVSLGTAVLCDDEIVMYTGEAHHGVCLCGSRAGMGRYYDAKAQV
jgi:hypothetical protein